MKTTFDKATRESLIARVKMLNDNSKPQWGKMTVYQMLKHNTTWEEIMAGKQKIKRAFIGRLFGKMALKNMIGDDKPIKHSMPTLPELIVAETDGDIESEKAKWIVLIEENALHPNTRLIHPFCGKMTVEQIGRMCYKHIDHHLRQFDC